MYAVGSSPASRKQRFSRALMPAKISFSYKLAMNALNNLLGINFDSKRARTWRKYSRF